MTDRVPFQARVDEDVLDEFRSYVADVHGGTHGTLGRETERALRDYMDETPDRRVERKVDQVLAHLRENEGARTHTSTVSKRVDQISRRIHDENGEAMNGDVVEQAIGEIAGYDPRTIDKYETHLKKRGLLYEDPAGNNLWYTDKELFFRQFDDKAVGAIEDYPEELEDEFWEWYEDDEE